MHEVSLAGGILNIVEDAAQRERFTRVRVLRLEAGSLAGVDVRALMFALETIAPGTLLEGAAIIIDTPVGQAWCMACAQTVPLHTRGDPCERCGGHQLMPHEGTELRVVDMQVED
ncbi:MAG: hydrogenase maturation nickel metallochaperone HypA [Proteobacteria bacterium]|nr:hydrogenase maturation nickel metallochaperone HypA [Pseudomonadota bacterium]